MTFENLYNIVKQLKIIDESGHVYKEFYEKIDEALESPFVQKTIKINGKELKNISSVPREYRGNGTILLYAEYPETLLSDNYKMLLLHAGEKGIHEIKRWLNKLERSYNDYTQNQKRENWKSISSISNFRGMKNPTVF
jgi:hypothetical protein